jgi:hypothetical protein
MAMSSAEFSELMIEWDEIINDLCDDLFGATKKKLPTEEMRALVTKAEKQVADYKALLKDVSGGRREEVLGYQNKIDYILQLLDKIRSR